MAFAGMIAVYRGHLRRQRRFHHGKTFLDTYDDGELIQRLIFSSGIISTVVQVFTAAGFGVRTARSHAIPIEIRVNKGTFSQIEKLTVVYISTVLNSKSHLSCVAVMYGSSFIPFVYERPSDDENRRTVFEANPKPNSIPCMFQIEHMESKTVARCRVN